MRKLDDIIPPSRRKDFEAAGAPPKQAPLDTRPQDTGRPQRSYPFQTIGVALLIIVAVVGVLFYFDSAKALVTPASAEVTVGDSFTALPGTGELPFEVVTAEKVAAQSVQGSGTKTVSESASGTITIYNTQPKTQPLVASTRFATKSGLVFRIKTAINVPKGSPQSPGSVQTTVYADRPGETYNVGPTTFVLPGLSGTPQYAQVTAVSSAPMQGGASGTVPVVLPDAEATARASLKTALAPQLEAALRESVPEGYVLLPGAATTVYTKESSVPSETTGMVEIREKGTITGAIFPVQALASAIAKNSLSGRYAGEPVTLKTIEGLVLTAEVAPHATLPSYSFSLAGSATLVYVIDPGRITAAISGKTRAAAEVALTNYPEIKKAKLILRPFWRQSFPEDPASIDVEVGKP